MGTSGSSWGLIPCHLVESRREVRMTTFSWRTRHGCITRTARLLCHYLAHSMRSTCSCSNMAHSRCPWQHSRSDCSRRAPCQSVAGGVVQSQPQWLLWKMVTVYSTFLLCLGALQLKHQLIPSFQRCARQPACHMLRCVAPNLFLHLLANPLASEADLWLPGHLHTQADQNIRGAPAAEATTGSSNDLSAVRSPACMPHAALRCS